MVYWQTLFCYSLPICNTTRHVRTRRPLSARTRNWFLLVPRFSLSMIFSNTLRRLELHSSESTANFFTKKYFWVELDAPEARKQFLRCLRVAGPMLTVQSNGSLGSTLCVHVHFLFSLFTEIVLCQIRARCGSAFLSRCLPPRRVFSAKHARQLHNWMLNLVCLWLISYAFWWKL